MPIKTRLMT